MLTEKDYATAVGYASLHEVHSIVRCNDRNTDLVRDHYLIVVDMDRVPRTRHGFPQLHERLNDVYRSLACRGLDHDWTMVSLDEAQRVSGFPIWTRLPSAEEAQLALLIHQAFGPCLLEVVRAWSRLYTCTIEEARRSYMRALGAVRPIKHWPDVCRVSYPPME